ncbi:MAG: type II 3-dehydroquinate dehydratase [Alphaproteobacteria bacterium]
MTSVLVVNGPNLNLLGMREPEIYGSDTLADLEAYVREHAHHVGIDVDFRQSNHEGEIIGWLQSAASLHDAIIINAAAYSHTSIAIADALKACSLPIIEVHLSNIFSREPYRHHSYIAPLAKGVICGLGKNGYKLALIAIAQLFDKQ